MQSVAVGDEPGGVDNGDKTTGAGITLSSSRNADRASTGRFGPLVRLGLAV
jgi:hypothetical protein